MVRSSPAATSVDMRQIGAIITGGTLTIRPVKTLKGGKKDNEDFGVIIFLYQKLRMKSVILPALGARTFLCGNCFVGLLMSMYHGRLITSLRARLGYPWFG